MSFTVLVGFHSYATLEVFADTVRPYEYALAAWFVSLTLEELRQVHIQLYCFIC